MSKYRVVVQFDPERSVFTARAPELGPQCTGEGATRAEAIGKVEEEIDAQVANAREQGANPPPALDDDLAGHDGTVTARVSRSLHRDLAFQARFEGVELSQLVGELLAGALDQRRRERPRRASGNVQPSAPPPGPGNEYGEQPRRDDRGPRRGGFGGGGRDRDGRYQAIMEDKATFLEYVRQLESGGGQRGGYGGGGSGGRGGQGGPRRDDRGPGRGPRRGPGGGPQGGSGGDENP